MTDKETIKRIEEEAEKYGSFRTTDRYKKIKVNSYIAGAKSERNKAIDDCIRKVNEVLIGHDYVVKELESLKL